MTYLMISNNLTIEVVTVAIQYDIQDYRNRVIAALEKLRTTQKPGDVSGSGTKTEVLTASREEIEKAIEAGYTPRQIADALKDGVFGVLPKTITQLFVQDRKPKRTIKSRKESANERAQTADKGGERTSTRGAQNDRKKSRTKQVNASRKVAGLFTVTPDTKDL
jgi:hypothetical protein